MDALTWLFFIIVLLLGVKAGSVLLCYIRLCRQLRKIPQRPSHWLLGNKIKDGETYSKAVMSMTSDEGVRMSCLWCGPFPFVSVSHPDTIQQLVKQTNTRSMERGSFYRFTKEWLGDDLFVSNGVRWERIRKLVSPAFSPDLLKAYAIKMNSSADSLMEVMSKRASVSQESIEIMDYLKRSALETILKCSMSYEDKDQNTERSDHPYFTAIQNIIGLLWVRVTNPILSFDFIYSRSKTGKEMRENVDVARNFTRKVIQERQQSMRTTETPSKRKIDFLDILLRARTEDGVGLTFKEIHDEVEVFTFAGHDTTTYSLSWAVYALAKYQDCQKLVRQEVSDVIGGSSNITVDDLRRLEYVDCFIKEALRYFTPVPVIHRYLDKPAIIDGVKIPAGIPVYIHILAAHHNPEIWKAPEEFRPERFNKENQADHHPNSFLAFSTGKRNCIGKGFAMNEMKVVIAKLVQRYELVLDEENKPVPAHGVFISPKNGLMIKLIPRHRK